MQPLRVVRVGGGIGGLTAALCLASTGHQVTVLERAHGFEEAGAGIQVLPSASRVLHQLGLDPPLRAKAFLPQGTEFRAWCSGFTVSRAA